MPNKHQHFMEQLIEALFDGEGITNRALRMSVTTATAAGGAPGIKDSSIPAVLKPYLGKVSRHAFKVTEGEVETLKEQGYSEDAIFELTVCAAAGAGLGRLERGLALLGSSRSIKVVYNAGDQITSPQPSQATAERQQLE